MCTGNRKGTRASHTVTSTIIRNVYKTIAPSSASGYVVLLFNLVSIILLGVTLLPQIFIYETDFTGFNNLNIFNGDLNVSQVIEISVGFAASWFSLTTTYFLPHASSGVPGKDTWVVLVPCNI